MKFPEDGTKLADREFFRLTGHCCNTNSACNKPVTSVINPEDVGISPAGVATTLLVLHPVAASPAGIAVKKRVWEELFVLIP